MRSNQQSKFNSQQNTQPQPNDHAPLTTHRMNQTLTYDRLLPKKINSLTQWPPPNRPLITTPQNTTPQNTVLGSCMCVCVCDCVCVCVFVRACYMCGVLPRCSRQPTVPMRSVSSRILQEALPGHPSANAHRRTAIRLWDLLEALFATLHAQHTQTNSHRSVSYRSIVFLFF